MKTITEIEKQIGKSLIIDDVFKMLGLDAGEFYFCDFKDSKSIDNGNVNIEFEFTDLEKEIDKDLYFYQISVKITDVYEI